MGKTTPTQPDKLPKRPATTAERLGTVIKSCRDIMRKDKGLNSDLDRLPMLTWIMFLKFLDDMEQIEESKAKMRKERFRPSIESPYRWRDWAAREDGITGPELIAFVNQEETVRPDGSKGLGLLKYLSSLQNGRASRRQVIGSVFSGVVNRMQSGYLLRDVINQVNNIHFLAQDELFTLGHLYESMLREMRDAAGDNGEFYTPRPVVRFMVGLVDPHLGETILDPACGTGGFLVETFTHLSKQAKTVQQRKTLQEASILGGEAKPLPYLLCQMNLLLHGLEAPQIDPENSLRFPLNEIGDRDRVDVILTNPPFGGEEERGILDNFPEDKQSAETAVLFLLLIMRKLRRTGSSQSAFSRAAVVVNDGLLSTKGVHARVKEQLLTECNLHTIVRLPKGVFAPYTPIKTNILFFDKSASPTQGVWYHEISAPPDRQMYTKTKPITSQQFADCSAWWNQRQENENAWYVPFDVLSKRGFDLDCPNPNKAHDPAKSEPKIIVSTIGQTLKKLQEELPQLDKAFAAMPMEVSKAAPSSLGDALSLRKEFISIKDDDEYRLVTAQLHGRGLRLRSLVRGRDLRIKKQQVLRVGDLVVAEIDAKMGGFGVTPSELAGAIVSSHYFTYEVDQSKLDLRFLEWFLRSGLAELWIQPYVKGSTNYASIRQHHFPLLAIRMPTLEIQHAFVERLDDLGRRVTEMANAGRLLLSEMESLVPAVLLRALNHID